MFGLCQGERASSKKNRKPPKTRYGKDLSQSKGGGCCAAAREIKTKNDYEKPEEYVSK